MKKQFLIILIFTQFILLSNSYAAFNERTCFCRDPKDCEVGFVRCSYDIHYNDLQYQGDRKAKFVSGDDPSPETSSWDLEELRPNVFMQHGYFASTCSLSEFGLIYSLKIFEVYNDNGVRKTKRILSVDPPLLFKNVSFGGAAITKSISLTPDKFKLTVTCSGTKTL